MGKVKEVIKKPEDLQTSYEEYRAGFLNQALEKNRRSEPIIQEAYALKLIASKLEEAEKLSQKDEIKQSLLIASGVSEKASKIISDEDKKEAIKNLIDKFLVPAGEKFPEELAFRYLLFKGDSFGGTMRNLTGKLAKEKFIRSIIASLKVNDIPYYWTEKITNKIIWQESPEDDYQIEQRCKAIRWCKDSKKRMLIVDFSFDIDGENSFKNNVDICLFEGDEQTNILEFKQNTKLALILGELKGGIDKAGADEHWKTANSALTRIRTVFGSGTETVFIGAAIEARMAKEIFNQLSEGQLTKAANLNNDNQLYDVADWIIRK
jgi:type-2 restriction enzyme bsoBI